MKFLRRVAQTTACKMSVRAHEYISLEQAKVILDDLFKCDNPYNCAHGRPTIVNYSAYELDRMFKRVMNQDFILVFLCVNHTKKYGFSIVFKWEREYYNMQIVVDCGRKWGTRYANR